MSGPTKLMIFGAVLLALGHAIHLVNDYTPKDDTDPAEGRSGMKLSTDAKTGCQYLSVAFGGITPRLDREGRQICESK